MGLTTGTSSLWCTSPCRPRLTTCASTSGTSPSSDSTTSQCPSSVTSTGWQQQSRVSAPPEHIKESIDPHDFCHGDVCVSIEIQGDVSTSGFHVTTTCWGSTRSLTQFDAIHTFGLKMLVDNDNRDCHVMCKNRFSGDLNRTLNNVWRWRITCGHQKAKSVNMSVKVFCLSNFSHVCFFDSLLGCSLCIKYQKNEFFILWVFYGKKTIWPTWWNWGMVVHLNGFVAWKW